MGNHYIKGGLCGLFLLIGYAAMAQQSIRAKVSDEKGEAIVGATAVMKGTLNSERAKGATTNADGVFVIENLANGNYTLVISSVGFTTRELKASVPGSENLSISLQETAADLDEVVVTGVFDKRSRMESSVAISVLNTKQLSMVTPISAADLLKNIPGVYVNSSLGEIRNTVYSRGVSVGSNDGASGYYYVSMQEDGLPVTNATYGNYGPDFFLRPDATLGRLEAVRGGTASILGNNAPGGIFNYVSKTGGKSFAGEVRAKFGLEGNGKQPFYRTDVNFGGPLSQDKTLTYNIGGFYRYANGARYPGYPMNNGGQVKANLVKSYKGGSAKLYLKYLDDHNAWYEFLPTIGFTNPRLPEGVEQTNSVLVPAIKADFTVNDTGEKRHYDSRSKIHSKDISIGLNLDHDLGGGWILDNKVRYSSKSSEWNATAVVYPFAVDGLTWYAVLGQLGQFGTYNFNDQATGTNLASITQAPNIINGQFAGFNFIVNNSSLPGQAVQKNSVLFNPLIYTQNNVKELIDQFTITKRFKNMSLTAGAFFASSAVERQNGVPGVIFSQITSPHPKSTTISYADFTGKTFQLTNSDGVVGGGNKSTPVSIADASQNQFALFAGHNWNPTEKLNIDWGLRYETIRIKGTNQIANATQSTTGGTDGNPLTLYDNSGGKITNTYAYDRTLNTLSFSAGVNYKFNNQYALYGRYSQGRKAPDMDIYLNVNSDATAMFLDPIAQNVQQIELGLKTRTSIGTFFITPFHSVLSNVAQQQTGQETADLSSTYSTPVLYNKYVTTGIELEGNINLTPRLSLRAVGTFQNATAVNYRAWLLGQNGKADDTVQDYSGNRTDNSARTILRLTPTYTTGKLFASIEWSYLGNRAANVPNAFDLPGFHQTNLNLGYNVTRKMQLQANINNLFNQIGIMGWSAPGGFPAALDRQGFTKAQLEANPNAVYSTLSIPPRAYFIALNYLF